MEMPGRNGGTGYRFGYQGSEKDDEVKGEGNSYATYYRQLDPRLGRWLSTDPKVTGWESPYVSMANNPILYNDALGDSIWTTTKGTVTTLHYTGKVINNSSNDIDMEEAISDIEEDFISTYSGTFKDSEGKERSLVVDIKLEGVTSLHDVDESDHLLVFSDVNHVEGNARGITNQIGGKLAYISGKDYPTKSSWFGISYTNTVIHEMGHMMGFEHNKPSKFNNLMNVGASGFNVSDSQRGRLIVNSQRERLNKGKPFIKLSTDGIIMFDTTIIYKGSQGKIYDYGHSLKRNL